MSRMLTLGLIRKLSMGAVAALTVFVLSGCGAPGMTAREVDRRHVNVVKTNWKMIQDDIDSFLLLEQPTRLTQMPVR